MSSRPHDWTAVMTDKINDAQAVVVVLDPFPPVGKLLAQENFHLFALKLLRRGRR